MAVKNYGIHDKWTDLDKLNNIDIKSVDGVIESVKINGEEAGGGGSSDFSTAEVTIVNGSESAEISIGVGAFAVEDQDYTTAIILDSTHGMQPITEDAFPVADSLTTTYVLITNKGMMFWKLNETRNVYAVTGNAEIIGVGPDEHRQFAVKVSGDCTIAIS